MRATSSSHRTRRAPHAWPVVAALGAVATAAPRAHAQDAGASDAQDAGAPGAAVAADTRPPRPIRTPQPVYPAGAHGEASVLLELTLDPSGAVTDARVIASAGEAFDEAALAAARQFGFEPAVRDGQPVGARLRYRLRFVEPAAPSPAAPAPPPTTPVPAPRATGAPRAAPRRAPVAPAAPARGGDDAELGITVRGVRAPREVSRITLERAEIERIPGSLGDALRSLQNLPGLARAPFLSGSLIVRGSAPGDTQVFVDGMPLPLLYHFGGLSSTIPTPMLDRIDFYPGNFSARFGRAVGGVVDVGLRSPTRTGARAGGNLGLLDATAYADAAITRTLSAAVAGRYAWGGYLASPVLAAATGANVFIGYWDYQGVLEWRPSDRLRLRFAVLGSSDTVTFVAPARMANAVETGLATGQSFHAAQALLTYALGGGAELRAMLGGGWSQVRLDLRSGQFDPVMGREVSQVTTTDLSSVPFSARAEVTLPIGRVGRVNFGIDTQWGVRMFRGLTTENSPIPRRDETSAVLHPGAYVEAELTPAAGLRVVPSVRMDISRATGAVYVAPRVSARWTFVPGWTVRGGVGYYTQPPITERPTLPVEFLILQNRVPVTASLRDERAVHAALGLEYQITRAISVSAEGFYRYSDQALVGFPSLDLLMTGEFNLSRPPAITSNGFGRAYGLEVLLRHRLSSRLFGWIAYTFMRAERRDTADGPWRPFEFDQTHNLVALASYDLGQGWEVGARFRYVTGRPATQPRVVADANSGSFASQPGISYAARLFDFHQLDLRVEKRFRLGWGTLALYLEILNVYNRANAEQYSYSADRTEMAPAAAYLPFFPNLGLRGEL